MLCGANMNVMMILAVIKYCCMLIRGGSNSYSKDVVRIRSFWGDYLKAVLLRSRSLRGECSRSVFSFWS